MRFYIIKRLTHFSLVLVTLAKLLRLGGGKPVSDSSNGYKPIADVNWSDLGNIVNIEDFDQTFRSAQNTSKPNSSAGQQKMKEGKGKKKPMTEADKERKRFYRQRYKAKLNLDPIRKEEARKKHYLANKDYKQRRMLSMSEEEAIEFRRKKNTRSREYYHERKIRELAGFSSKRALEWHRLKSLEKAGEASETDLIKLKNIRNKDRDRKRKRSRLSGKKKNQTTSIPTSGR